ncbi:MAG: PQQ-dependent sugar dehydrogenase [Clostridiales bacterium]|nr:PQQ-dependent sugar dehydrogenase [Clostridiales bacterium]
MNTKYDRLRIWLIVLMMTVPLWGAAAQDAPALKSEVLAAGLSHPWDIGQLPDGSLLFTQRNGELSLYRDGQVVKISSIPEVYVQGEGGLTGLAIDHDFFENRLIYLAYNTRQSGVPQVRVTRYYLGAELNLKEALDIVTDIPANKSGRHSGTQLEMGADGVLWIGTGDAANAVNPQDPKSLGGKILRVSREGKPAEGNLGEPFDPRIFSYGHRNTQGLVILPQPEDGVFGYSAEHGSHIEDEFNALVPGNFGWAPLPPYRESVPMTDKNRFPDAIDAVWNSGSSTIAVSGLTQLRGAQWGSYENAFVMGVLKDQQLRLLKLEDGVLASEETLFKGEFGRIRAVHMGHDGFLYISTDKNNGSIIRIGPQN